MRFSGEMLRKVMVNLSDVASFYLRYIAGVPMRAIHYVYHLASFSKLFLYVN